MAVKTITIDIEAYELLARHKGAGQSFSQVIKERFVKGSTGRELASALESLELDEATLVAVEEAVARRSGDAARLVDL